MKHFIFLLLTLCAVVCSQRASAQSLDDLMRGLSSLFSAEEPAKEAPKDVYPPLDELFGRFKYDALAIDYSGDSTLAALAVSTLEGQLALIAEKAGFVVGRDYVDVTDDGTMVIVRDGHKAQAYCSSYDQATGRTTIMMRLAEQQSILTKLIYSTFYTDGKCDTNPNIWSEDCFDGVPAAEDSAIDFFSHITDFDGSKDYWIDKHSYTCGILGQYNQEYLQIQQWKR